MKYESAILKRLIDTYGVIGNPRYISEIIKEFIVRGKERFPNLFTYQSDWLAHIDEFGLSPTYTVSYTGQSIYAPNTLERPVKSAILKGQTSFDVLYYTFSNQYYLNINDGSLIFGKLEHRYVENYFAIPEGTKTITLKGNNNYKKICYYDNNKQFIIGYQLSIVTTDDFVTDVPTNASYFRFNTSLTQPQSSTIIIDEYLHVYLDGFLCFTNKQGYTEGARLISCKMPVLTTSNGSANILTDSQLNDKTGEIGPHHNSNKVIEDYILIPNNPVIVSNVSWLKISFYDANKVYISNTGVNNINKFELNDTTIPDNAKYFRFHYNSANLPLIRFDNGTDYIKATIGGEPFNSNILTVNEDVTLRSNGSVYDELDLLTGKLTQRIDEDGSVLTQEVVKTVDLSILDQNGQSVKQLMSFNGGTHFNTGSLEGTPLPSVSVSVETDLEETLAVCSLEGNTM